MATPLSTNPILDSVSSNSSNKSNQKNSTTSNITVEGVTSAHTATNIIHTGKHDITSVDRQSSLDPTDRGLRRPEHQSSLSSRFFHQLRKILDPRNSFRFSDYSPSRFKRIRELSGVKDEEYLNSFNATTMPNFSEGRSGAFMYFTTDYKYIVKTHTRNEIEKLLTILPAYEMYLIQEQKHLRQPLLTRFLGAHRIIMYDIPIYFVVMKNICPKHMDEKYDLKGSWINRHGSKKKKDARSTRPKKSSVRDPATGELVPASTVTGSAPLFLDNDLQNCFLIEYSQAKEVAAQVYRDTRFLEERGLMDYSLLVGVRRRTFELENLALSSPSPSPKTSFASHTSANTSTLANKHSPVRPRKSLALLSQQYSSNTVARLSISHHNNHHIPLFSNNQEQNSEMNTDTGHSDTKTGGIDEVEISSEEKQQQQSTVQQQQLNQLEEEESSGLLHVIQAAQVEGSGTFYLGLIDILQEYNWNKWMERMLKIIFLQKDGDGISSIDPTRYRARFLQRAIIEVFDGLSSLEEILDEEDFKENEADGESKGAVDSLLGEAGRFSSSQACSPMSSQSSGGGGGHLNYGSVKSIIHKKKSNPESSPVTADSATTSILEGSRDVEEGENRLLVVIEM